MLSVLSGFADSQPHAAYSVFTHGLSSKWLYLCRTVRHLQPLESTIRFNLLPPLTGKDPPNDQLRNLFALPARYGGLGIVPPSSQSLEFDNSYRLSQPLISLILSQDTEYTYELYCEQMNIKNSIRSMRSSLLNEVSSTVRESLSNDLQYAMDLAQEKGASNWLTTLPIREHGFTLHKGDFRDALALRYGWTPTHCPSHCPCGTSFSVCHVQKGVFLS